MNNAVFFELEEEKKKILKMVEEKKISAEEADRLINILEESVLKEEAQQSIKKEQTKEENLKKVKIPDVKGKIVVQVIKNGVKVINVQLPIALAKIADKFPLQNNYNNQIPIKDLLKTAKENGLNIDEGMYILIEEDQVHIYDVEGREFVSIYSLESFNN